MTCGFGSRCADLTARGRKSVRFPLYRRCRSCDLQFSVRWPRPVKIVYGQLCTRSRDDPEILAGECCDSSTQPRPTAASGCFYALSGGRVLRRLPIFVPSDLRKRRSSRAPPPTTAAGGRKFTCQGADRCPDLHASDSRVWTHHLVARTIVTTLPDTPSVPRGHF